MNQAKKDIALGEFVVSSINSILDVYFLHIPCTFWNISYFDFEGVFSIFVRKEPAELPKRL